MFLMCSVEFFLVLQKIIGDIVTTNPIISHLFSLGMDICHSLKLNDHICKVILELLCNVFLIIFNSFIWD